MRIRFLFSVLSLVAGISFATQVDAASITVTDPSTCSGVATVGEPLCALSIEMVFGGSEGPQAFQLSLDLVDSVGNATTGAGIFTVSLTGPTSGWTIPASSLNAVPGTGNVFGAGTDFAAKATGQTLQAFEITLSPTGNIGTLSLVVDSASSFWSPDGVTQNAFSGSTIATFSTIPIPEPTSILLMGSGLAALGLVRRKRA